MTAFPSQQDNCICRVIIENQIQSLAIGLRKYDGLLSAAPTKADCGLAVDINHIPGMSSNSGLFIRTYNLLFCSSVYEL
jgi:uncharacterized protein (UPF0276 family)